MTTSRSRTENGNRFCAPIEKSAKGESAGVSLNVRLVPRSSKNEVVGPYNGMIKIKVQSPPVDGAANAALITFLAKLLKRPKSSVTILSGHKSKEKRLLVVGVSVEETEAALLK